MAAGTILDIMLDELELGPNVRQCRDDERVNAIVLSAGTNGILVPIDVEPGKTKKYSLVDGWHRVGAAEKLGLKSIPARLLPKSVSDAERTARQLCVNTLRSNYNAIERAHAANRLKDETGHSQAETAANVGMKEPAFTRMVALCRLPEAIQQLIAVGKISASAGYQLTRIEDPREQWQEAEALAGGKSTRDGVSEKVLKRSPASRKSRESRIDVQLGAGHAFKYTGPAISFDSLVEHLELFLSRARKYRRKGVELADFVTLLNAEAKAEVGP
jgi:ParB family transcriptional regulator, chromosome partitioning protein